MGIPNQPALPRSRRWRAGLAVAVALVTGLCLWVAYRLLVPSGEVGEEAAYYRITTNVVTEGQPLELDVVVRCGGYAVARTPGGSGALDYTQVPYIYGLPTPAGHAVLMRVPNFCGLIRSGYEQAKAYREKLKSEMVLPLLFFAPDRDDLSRMTAYTSLKGYESEGSQLTYGGSRFAEVTRAEWLAWKQRDPAFVTRKNDPFFDWRPSGRVPRGRFGPNCFGLLVFTVPDHLRAQALELRPPDAPAIWSARNLTPATRRAIADTQARDAVGRELWPMHFVGGAKPGVDLLPFEVRQIENEPLAADRADVRGGYSGAVPVRTIDLDTPIRGRAECSDARKQAKSITLFRRGGMTTRMDDTDSFFIGSNVYIDLFDYAEAKPIEGSYEGLDQ